MSTEIKAPIREVTVFVDGARTTRRGTAKLTKGEQHLLLSGITHHAQEDSFRVKGRGHAVILGIEVRSKKEVFEPEGDLEELRTKLERLEDERLVLNDQITLQQSRVERLRVIVNSFSAEFGNRYAFGDSAIAAMSELDAKTKAMLTEAQVEIRDLQLRLEDIDAEIAEVRAQLSRIEGERRVESTKEVTVELDVKEDCEVSIEMTYQIQQARWLPQYDIDLMGQKTAMKRLAIIWNYGLEDWKDVELTVSTASAKPVTKVKPSPYYISTIHPQQVYAERDRARGEIEDLMFEAHMAREEPALGAIEDMTVATARAAETAGGGMVFKVPGTVTIPADRDQHPITLLEEEFDSEELYYWNAYAMDTFVVQNRITNGDSLILPGKVKVYSNGNFLSETATGMIAPREEFYLGARGAYDLKADKKMVEKETEKAGLTRGRKRREYKYQLKLESFAKEDISLRIVDRIPHSDSEKITVQLDDFSHEYKTIELRVIEWELDIKTEEEVKIEYTYSVEWEKDIQIRPPLP
jgi:uncharacterized protein (TIGR02231 family)